MGRFDRLAELLKEEEQETAARQTPDGGRFAARLQELLAEQEGPETGETGLALPAAAAPVR